MSWDGGTTQTFAAFVSCASAPPEVLPFSPPWPCYPSNLPKNPINNPIPRIHRAMNKLTLGGGLALCCFCRGHYYRICKTISISESKKRNLIQKSIRASIPPAHPNPHQMHPGAIYSHLHP
jgi:hypothetical protein